MKVHKLCGKAIVLICGFFFAVVALSQDSKDRVDAIMARIGEGLDINADNEFQRGDFPLAAQMLKVKFEIDLTNEESAANLILLLRSMTDEVGALAVAMRFREENPQNPDRGLAEAQWYWQMRQFTRIPKILSPDIMRTPPPHPNTFRLLGNAYDRLGFNADALKVWEQAVKVYPQDETFARNVEKAKKKLGL